MKSILFPGMLLLGMLAGSASGTALAQEAGADKLPEIRAQQLELKARLGAGGTDHLSIRQRNAIQRAQAEVFALIEGKERLDELDIGQKVELENALERINANYVGTLAAGGDQQVCKRVPLTGSSVKTTRCASQAEWDRLRQASRDSLEKPRICAKLGGCAGGP